MSEITNTSIYAVGYMDALKAAFRQFANFSGRSSLGEFWRFMVMREIITDFWALIYILASSHFGEDGTVTRVTLVIDVIIYFVFALPTLAATSRRLHDIGKSGWNMLLGFIPIAGFFIVLAMLASKGNPDANLYGERVGYVTVTPEMAGELGVEPTPAARQDVLMASAAVIIYVLGSASSFVDVAWLMYNRLGVSGVL